MRMPTFIVIGAAKCGTTALYRYLLQHPEVYMSPVKEPRFFALDGLPLNFGGPYAEVTNRVSINTLSEYQTLFSGVQEEKAIGEASPLYLYSPQAPERIRHHVPDVKMIAVLRDPVERAFSGYLMNAIQNREKLSFEEAIADEPRRIRENWIWGRYVSVGKYAEQLERYFSQFERSQMKIFLHDDLIADTNAVLKEVFTFIGVDNTFAPDTVDKHNASGMPKNKLLHAVVGQGPHRRWFRNVKPYIPESLLKYKNKVRERNLVKQQLDPGMRERLIPLFRDDVLRLQEMIQRDLSHWLQATKPKPTSVGV